MSSGLTRACRKSSPIRRPGLSAWLSQSGLAAVRRKASSTRAAANGAWRTKISKASIWAPGVLASEAGIETWVRTAILVMGRVVDFLFIFLGLVVTELR
jgi:hypothetical protein